MSCGFSDTDYHDSPALGAWRFDAMIWFARKAQNRSRRTDESDHCPESVTSEPGCVLNVFVCGVLLVLVRVGFEVKISEEAGRRESMTHWKHPR